MTARDPVRIGDLKRMAQSPAHYRASAGLSGSHINKGSALHAVLLGGKPVVECTMRRDARTKAYQEFMGENEESIILSGAEYADVNGMVKAVRAHPEATLLLSGFHEETLYWDWLGRECRGTPDVRTPERIVELKTTKSSNPRVFQREADRLGYDTQLTWYEHGSRMLGCPLFIVAVESSAPYAVTVLRMADDRREKARAQMRLWLERLIQCEATDEWPAYTDAPVDWALEPSWNGRQDSQGEIDPEALA